LEKGYDRFQQLLSQLEAHGAEVSTKDANYKFLSKSSTNKVKSGFTGAYITCTPSTSSTNIPKKEVLAGFADEVIYSLFAKQTKDLDLLHEDLEQIDDVDIKEMDINWQIAMIAIRIKKSRQPVPYKTSNSFSPKRPQMNHINQRRDFSKSYSSIRRPFAKTTAQMSHSNAVMGNWRTAVKTSASYNWRNSRPNFNYNSGLTFVRTVNAKGLQGRPKPVKA
ncbi:hypothetical protein Tco_0095515, partial [Tanacetum coccineum]